MIASTHSGWRRAALLAPVTILVLSACPKSAPSAGPTPSPTAATSPTPAPAEVSLATVDELARTVLAALRTGDEATFKRCVATPSDLRDIAAHYEISTPQALNAVMNRHEASTLRALESFSRVREYAKTDGLTWADVTLENVKYEVQTESGISFADAHLRVRAGETAYELQLDDCIKTQRGWVVTDRPIWLGPAGD